MFRSISLFAAAMLAACNAAPDAPATRGSEGPADAAPESCHARGVTPAILETVTEQTQEAAAVTAADGTVTEPGRFRTETSTRIVRPRGTRGFETPCALRDGDADFIAQVQRALKVRGFYDGPDHGDYDAATRAAVRAFQKGRGLDSGTLSLEAAKDLGLVALGRDGV